MPTILLVEDVEDVNIILARMLRRLGHSTQSAHSSAEASRILAKQQVDLLLTDICMPGGDGLDLIREVRSDRPNLPIVAMSGGAPKRPIDLTISQARKAGANATLLKPIERAELAEMIGALLGRKLQDTKIDQS